MRMSLRGGGAHLSFLYFLFCIIENLGDVTNIPDSIFRNSLYWNAAVLRGVLSPACVWVCVCGQVCSGGHVSVQVCMYVCATGHVCSVVDVCAGMYVCTGGQVCRYVYVHWWQNVGVCAGGCVCGCVCALVAMCVGACAGVCMRVQM